MNGFGDRLVIARKNRGLTQAQLAEAVYIHRKTIGMYEQGRRLPDADILAGLVTVLGCDVYWLLGIEIPEHMFPIIEENLTKEAYENE